LKHLKNLKDQTDSLQKAINELAVDKAIREYVNEEIAFSYAISKYENPVPILKYVGTFERELERFSKACQDTISFLSNHDFWPAGGAWEIWMRELTGILDCHRLPTSARKDSDKTRSEKTSDFVQLVAELQQLIPPQFRRHYHSKPALATAIHSARKYTKPLVSSRREPPVGSDKN
jgi:hypothetical protein